MMATETELDIEVTDRPRVARRPQPIYSPRMPELAEVEYFRKRWDPGLGGAITGLQLHAQKRIFRGTDVRALKRRLVRQKLVRSKARGKQLLFQFGDRNWLGIHLGMSGQLRVEPAGFRAEKYDHLVLEQKERALIFNDPRQFGRVRFQHSKAEPEWWQARSPDITSRDFTKSTMGQFLDRHRRAPIKAVLLLQEGFPGIGNWMVDEILWRAKIRPAVRTSRLTNLQRANLLRATKFVARRSLETLGEDDSDLPRGWLIHQRWSRAGICPRHRIPLRHATIGGRTTAWCPSCQR